MRINLEIPVKTFRALFVNVSSLHTREDALRFDESTLRQHPDWMCFFRPLASIESADIARQGFAVGPEYQILMTVTWYEPGQLLRAAAILPKVLNANEAATVPMNFCGLGKAIFDNHQPTTF